jgi:adenylosuccinate lyase
VNHAALEADLNEAWEVLAEPVQTVMRKHGHANPYEKLKELTRGARITGDAMREFVGGLDLPASDRDRLLQMTPASYVGMASELAETVLSDNKD